MVSVVLRKKRKCEQFMMNTTMTNDDGLILMRKGFGSGELKTTLRARARRIHHRPRNDDIQFKNAQCDTTFWIRLVLKSFVEDTEVMSLFTFHIFLGVFCGIEVKINHITRMENSNKRLVI